MEIKSALVEHTDGSKILNCSGIIFNKKWVIFPASMLITSLPEMPEYLLSIPPGELFYKNYFKINENNTKIITESNLTKVPKSAKFYGCFSCKNLRSTRNFPLVPSDIKDYRQITFILSLFIIVNIDFDNNDTFLSSVRDLLKYCGSVSRGTCVVVESTPFGSKDLFSSLTKGIVSNCFGDNRSYFLMDTATAPGSEGGPVFFNENTKSLEPIYKLSGIVISAVPTWRGEQTGFTLGASIIPLLTQLVPGSTDLHNNNINPSRNNSIVLEAIDASLAQIFCGSEWGTAILLNKTKAIFITAAHTIPQTSLRITFKWRNVVFEGTVLFKSDNKSPFDIAIVQGSTEAVKNMKELKTSLKIPQKGDEIKAAGYPIFQSSEIIHPTVCQGHISLIKPCVIHTTCTILSGSSGGAIVNMDGELIGIIICHTILPLDETNIVYPKINMAVPIHAILEPIQEFIKSGNVKMLEKINERSTEAVNSWRPFQSKL